MPCITGDEKGVADMTPVAPKGKANIIRNERVVRKTQRPGGMPDVEDFLTEIIKNRDTESLLKHLPGRE